MSILIFLNFLQDNCLKNIIFVCPRGIQKFVNTSSRMKNYHLRSPVLALKPRYWLLFSQKMEILAYRLRPLYNCTVSMAVFVVPCESHEWIAIFFASFCKLANHAPNAYLETMNFVRKSFVYVVLGKLMSRYYVNSSSSWPISES